MAMDETAEGEAPTPPVIEAPTKPAADPDTPPDGGLQAWLHVLGSFMLVFNTWGILNAFGVYQTYYESGALFHKSSSDISWVGSLEAFMLLVTGFLAGPIFDRGYLRLLLLVGGFMVVFGHMMLSLCNTYWQVLLAQGLVIGIGTGCLFVPCVAILPQYFTSKLGLTTGLAIGGSSLGGILYPIVLLRLIHQIDFGWAVRVIGFIAFSTLLVPITILRQRVMPPKARDFIDLSSLTDASYVFLVITSFVAYMGLFVILFYLSYYAADQHITGTTLAFYLVPIFNAGSCFGRTIPNALSDKTGPFNLIAPGSFIVGVLMLCMRAVTTKEAIIIVVLLSGFVSGVLIGILPLCFVALTKDKSKLGTRMGMGFAFIGLGVLAGGPGSGSILGEVDPLNWHGVWIFGGVSAFVAGCGYTAIRVAKYGFKLNVKA
jgi:MFS family permease